MNLIDRERASPVETAPKVLIAGLFISGVAIGATALWALSELEQFSPAGARTSLAVAKPAAPHPVARQPVALDAIGVPGEGTARPTGIPVEPPMLAEVTDRAPEASPDVPVGTYFRVEQGFRELSTPRPATSDARFPRKNTVVGGTPLEQCAPTITVSFRNNSSIPDLAAEKVTIESISRWLERHPALQFSLEGHADASGSPESNLLLSFRRAATVKGELLRYGIPRERIEVVAMGDLRPIDGLPPTSAANRRVIGHVRDHEPCDSQVIQGWNQ